MALLAGSDPLNMSRSGMKSPSYYNNDNDGWWGMDLQFVRANKDTMGRASKTDANGTYNLLTKAAALDRDDIAAELLDVEGSMKLDKQARLNNVDLKPGFDCLHTALACKSDKVLDLLINKMGGKIDASHVTPDG